MSSAHSHSRPSVSATRVPCNLAYVGGFLDTHVDRNVASCRHTSMHFYFHFFLTFFIIQI